MMLRVYAFIVSVVLLGVAPCAAYAEVKATVVQLKVTEVNSQQYDSRLIVTPDFVRFDDGKDGNDFLLFDRKKKTIYNSSAQDQTVLVIRNQKIKLPAKTDWKHAVDTDNEILPSIGGKKVKHWVLLTNNVICYDLYAAKGLMPEVTTALAEYRKVLATQQAAIYVNSPQRKRGVCDLANNIYLPDRYLKHGFPIRYRDKDGRGEELIDYKQAVPVKDALFVIPENYSKYSIGDMR